MTADETALECRRAGRPEAPVSLADAARQLRIGGVAPGRRLCAELLRRQPYHAAALMSRTAGRHRRVDMALLRRECSDLFAAADMARELEARRAEVRVAAAVEGRLGEQLELFGGAVGDVVDAAKAEMAAFAARLEAAVLAKIDAALREKFARVGR